jgi:hypothetical protein
MPKERWNDERSLVKAASSDASTREQLRKALRLYITPLISEFARRHHLTEFNRAELIEIGMSPFDRVFNIYLENGWQICEKSGGHFYRYYVWWMRQEVVKAVKSQ